MAPRSQKKPAARVTARAVKQRSGGGAAPGREALSIRCVGGTLRAEVGGRQSPELQASKSQRRLWSRARELLQKEGLVVLRGLLPAALVSTARTRLLRELSAAKALRPGTALDSAIVAPDCLDGEVPMPSLLRRLDLQALPEVLAVLEHENLFEATANILQVDEVVTTAYKWLRAVPPTTFTGPHMDRAYVGEGRRLTAWIPLGPVRCGQRELGSLCWIPGSHTNPAVIERFGLRTTGVLGQMEKGVVGLQPMLAPSHYQKDSSNQRTPSSKRVYDLQEISLVGPDARSLALGAVLTETLVPLTEFQQDPTEHASLSNVLGPNPWNVGFILNGQLPEQVIQLLKAFLRSVVMKFPKAYSLEEAVMPAAKRGKLRMCKLSLESVGSWSQISLVHVAAFCSHERLEQDLHLILSSSATCVGLKGNINARALFDVELDFPREQEGLIIKEKVACSVLPIHFAVYAGNVHAIKVLIRCRAAVESRATFDAVPDYTPLHLATTLWARAGDDAVIQHQVVKILLENTADPTTMDLSGATCNDLRPQGGASASTLRSLRLRNIGIKRGMVVELNLDAIAKKGTKARFLETADARRSEFVVMADAEERAVTLTKKTIYFNSRFWDTLEESRVLKIQQCCVSVLGYRFFQCCLRHVLDYLFGTIQMPSPRSMMDSPIIRSRTLEEESAAAEGSLTVQDFRLGGPSKRRAVTIADFHGEDVMSDSDLEPGILPDVEMEHAVKMKLSNPLRPGKFYRKRNRVAEGYLLHFAIDEMVREEDRKWNVAAEDVLQLL
ncbi:pntH, partial [Symbiodinium sp. KB8]